MSPGRFLAGIAALIWNPNDSKYLILKRSPEKDFASGYWECVTGRVDQGESFTDAVHREVFEELGVQVQIDFIVGTTHFYRGDPVEDNELLAVMYCCSIQQKVIPSLSIEHIEQRWIAADDALELFGRDYWLAQLIQRAEIIRSSIPSNMLDYIRKTGFEIR